MNNQFSITESAKNTLLIEAESIKKLRDFINSDFEKAVLKILSGKGRLVITGIGKSANIANKLVATFNSTGTPSLFMHAADAVHGDLGIVQKDDIVMCISNSGNSPEIKVLIPLVKSMGNLVIGMVGKLQSFLAQESDIVINTSVEKEACPNNLAPTSSTTAQLAMGDAMAVCLMEARGFTDTDFAKYHPGGALGKKLYTRMKDLLRDQSKPQVEPQASLRKVIIEISTNRLGAAAVVENNEILGVITDGDLRRMLESHESTENLTAKDIMSANPKTISQEELAVKGFQLMESNNITQVIVTENNEYVGIVHLHDILKEGIY